MERDRKSAEEFKMTNLLIADKWKDYELIDSGDGEKLERFGGFIVIRPEPRIIWKKKTEEFWKKADGLYTGEEWKFNNDPPLEWRVAYENIVFNLKPTEFKHVGVFPEQAVNWDWLKERVKKDAKVLNLFAYTGGATIAAALGGAQVTHVDASRPTMMWASENAKQSHVAKDRIRWIQDDVMKFIQREIRRGVKYDGIIMDPPRFGRGVSGEVWKLENDLPKLVQVSRELLSATPLFFLVNAYTADLSHLALENLLAGVMNDKVESGELGLKESEGGRILPAGIFARWCGKM
jgi:23S rRNA (cytosine1962-C5)-methyltransferase